MVGEAVERSIELSTRSAQTGGLDGSERSAFRGGERPAVDVDVDEYRVHPSEVDAPHDAARKGLGTMQLEQLTEVV